MQQTMKTIPFLTLTVHVSDLRFDMQNAETALQEVLALNANGIRTDICWSDIEPRMGCWDEDRIRWYQAFFKRARQLNLNVIGVLYSMPNWVRVLSLRRPAEFLERWRLYCQRAQAILGDSGEVIQVWNEVNHPYYGWVSRHVLACVFRIARESLDRRRQLAVNVYDGIPWQTYLNGLLADAGDCIDIIGLDVFPETYKLANAGSWNTLETLFRRVNDPRDAWYGKKPALLETGFSTYIPLLKSPSRQAQWIRSNFHVVNCLNERFDNCLHILNWYKLCNDRGEGPLNIIAHFGIVSTIRKGGIVLRKQPAFAALSEEFGSLRAEP